MKISSSMANLFEGDGVRGFLLVSIAFGDTVLKEYVGNERHIGEIPGAIRAGSGPCRVDSPNLPEPLFYKPTLLEWASIEEKIDPISREVSPKSARIALSADSGFPKSAISPGSVSSGVLRIDYWMEGLGLYEAVKVFEGAIRSVNFLSEDSGVEISADDDDIFGDEEFPPGNMKIEADGFPGAPKRVLGAYGRMAILGPFMYPITCPQIDQGGRTFYLCDHPILSPPTEVMKGDGTPIPSGSWRIATIEGSKMGLSPFDRNKITVIRLSNSTGGELPYIMCQGGYGLSTSKKPALVLAEDFGGYRLSRRAREILGSDEFDQGVLVRAKGSIKEILSDRLALQTGHFLGFRNGQIELYSISGEPTGTHLIVGGNTWGRTRTKVEETTKDKVFNSIEISFHRNLFSQNYFDAGRNLYVLNSSSAKGDLRKALIESEINYGARHIKMEFPDTFIRNPEYQGYPAIVEKVARDFLALARKQRRIIQYAVPIRVGISIRENDNILLTDPNMEYSAAAARVIGRTLEPWGYKIDLMMLNT